MEQAINTAADTSVFTEAVISKQTSDGYLAAGPETSVKAQRAASCLLEPGIGDQVLVAAGRRGYYIIAVLEQAQPDNKSFKFHPALQLNVSAGRAQLTTPCLDVASQRFTVSAESCRFNTMHFTMAGELFRCQSQKIQQTAEVFDQAAQHFSLQAGYAHQWVSHLHHLQAGQARTIIQEQYRMDCQGMDVYAQYDIKLDGEQVFLG